MVMGDVKHVQPWCGAVLCWHQTWAASVPAMIHRTDGQTPESSSDAAQHRTASMSATRPRYGDNLGGTGTAGPFLAVLISEYRGMNASVAATRECMRAGGGRKLARWRHRPGQPTGRRRRTIDCCYAGARLAGTRLSSCVLPSIERLFLSDTSGALPGPDPARLCLAIGIALAASWRARHG